MYILLQGQKLFLNYHLFVIMDEKWILFQWKKSFPGLH